MKNTLATLGILIGLLFAPLAHDAATTTDSSQNQESHSSQTSTAISESSTSFTDSSSSDASSVKDTMPDSTLTNDSTTDTQDKAPPTGEKQVPTDSVWSPQTGYFTISATTPLWRDQEQTAPSSLPVGTTLQLTQSMQLPTGELWEMQSVTGELYYTTGDVTRKSDNAFGLPDAFSGYLVITDPQAVFQSETSSETLPVTGYLRQTLTIAATTVHFDGTSYYHLLDAKGQDLGWLSQSSGKLTDAQGIYYNHGKYLHLKTDAVIWTSFAFKNQKNSQSFLKQTLQAKGLYYHANGDVYLSIYSANAWVGYVKENQVNYASNAQGHYLADGRYVTITKKGYSIWSSFSWNKKNSSDAVYGKTYLAKGHYRHFNGSTYVSLYDQKNNWIGYLNQGAVQFTNNPQGIWQNCGKYVTITNKNYTLWSSFAWNPKQKSAKIFGKTYYAQGKYQHFNGDTYYSLYDNQNKWQGYLNTRGATMAGGKQGIWQKGGQQVIITKQNWDLWSSFAWKSKGKTNNYRSKLFIAQGYYQHFNGSRYLSLYDKQGKWYGYLNADATRVESSTKAKLQKVQTMLNSKYKKANLGIHVMSLIDGESAQINGNQTFMAASTGKLPILYYTQKQINEKRLDPNKLYTYTDKINTMSLSYMRGGAGILQGKAFGTRYSLNTIMNWTCKYSDNQGANFLGYYAGNQYDQKMKNEISRVLGRKWDRFRYVTARENSLLLKEIYHNGGQVLSYLSNTTYDYQRIPKYIPVRVAHKIGDLYGYAHDCGIVYTNKPFIISIMTNNSSYETISKIAKDVYDLLK